jgi:hypothetical protein
MNWRKLPTWLKGGIIGALVYAGILLVMFLLFYLNSVLNFSSGTQMSLLFPLLLVSAAPSARVYGVTPNPFLLGATQFIVYFVIGSVIGLLIQKIKRKK